MGRRAVAPVAAAGRSRLPRSKNLRSTQGGPAADDAFKRTEREVVLQAQLRDMGYQIAEVASDQESAGRPLPEELTSDEVRRLCYVLGILPDSLQELLDSSRSLAQLYQSIRDSKESSWERTVEMERLVREARQSARGQTPTLVWWAASNLIAEDFPGNRVTALAMLQVQPSTQFLSFILAAIGHSRSAFEQYHALLAAEPLIPLLDSAQKREMVAVIEVQQQPGGFIETDTDRWRLSEGILRALRTDTSGKSNGPTATRGGVVNTGRGVAFAGNGNVVITGKVGGDVTVGNSRPPSGNVDKASFLRQLAALRRDIEALDPQALTQDDRADALDALAKASAQADRPQPPGERIVRALDNVLEILETVDAGLAAQVQRARRLAKQLFH